MAEITARLVKELRERTGAGMMECKKALQEANGNLGDAEVVLRKRGIAAAAKKATRATKQGLIASYLSADAKLGVLVEVNCESDFVARTDEFRGMAQNLAKQVAEGGSCAAGDAGVAQLMEQPYIADPSVTVGQLIAASIAKIGENQGVPRLARVASLEAPLCTAARRSPSALGSDPKPIQVRSPSGETVIRKLMAPLASPLGWSR